MNAETIDSLIQVYPLIVPEAMLLLAACILFVGATFRQNRHLWALVGLLSLTAAGWAAALSPIPPATESSIFTSPVQLDALAQIVKLIAVAGGGILILLSWNSVQDAWAAEFHACLLLIVAGLCLTGSANELVTLFLALELISIPTYILLYLPKTDTDAQEAAMKYFLLSVFSSALLLFGFSYLYGLAGTTNIPALMQALYQARGGLPAIAQVALVMVVAGLCFRITAVPFHFYAPDVYQGTSTAGAALLAFVPKVAGFAALLRILGYVLPESLWQEARPGPGFALGSQVPMLMWILAAVTMTLGNVLALLQDNLKRLLAYSSVAHAGYMLIGLAAAPHLGLLPSGTAGGIDAVLFYLVAYGAMTVGAFGVVAYLDTPARPVETVDDLAGVSRSHPAVALLMAVFLFSLIGIPLTAGFAGKFLLFWGAMNVATETADPAVARLFGILAVIGVLNAAIGAWYYLRIVAVMYLRHSLRPPVKTIRWPGLATLWLCAALTIGFGVYPWALLRPARAVGQPSVKATTVERATLGR